MAVNIPSFEIIQANMVPQVTNKTIYAAADFAGQTVDNTHEQTTPGASTSAILVTCPSGFRILVREVVVTTWGGASSFIGTVTDSSATGHVSNNDDYIVFTCNKNGSASYTTPFYCITGNHLVGCWCLGNSGSATLQGNTITVFYNLIPV